MATRGAAAGVTLAMTDTNPNESLPQIAAALAHVLEANANDLKYFVIAVDRENADAVRRYLWRGDGDHLKAT